VHVPKKANGPRPVTGSRPNAQISAVTATSITQRASGRRAPLTARVSLLVPSGRRTRWWYLVTCPVCYAPHLGRSRDLPGVTGKRRLPCGHWVAVAIARTYGRTESAA
jgi:hypothetical protein